MGLTESLLEFCGVYLAMWLTLGLAMISVSFIAFCLLHWYNITTDLNEGDEL